MIKVAELFSGTGCQTQGLKNVGIDHVCYTSEWEINAIISYDALHTYDGIDYSKDKTKSEILEELSEFTFSTDGKKPCNLQRVKESRLRQLYNAQQRNNNLGSVVDIKELPKVDMVIHSSPCQSFSVAGKQDGGEKNSETSSSLMWETVRLVRKSKPKFILWENVKNVLSKKHRPVFDEYLNELDNLGYKSYYEVLNAKDYGIPQNRERIFCLSVRKDIDNGFEFPKKQELNLKIRDMLDDKVDEKFYLSESQTKNIFFFNSEQDKLSINRIANIYGEDKGTGYAGNVWDKTGLIPTLTTMQGGNRQPMIVASRGRKKDGKYTQNLESRSDDLTNTITTVQKDNYTIDDTMGFDDSPRFYDKFSPSLRASRIGLKTVGSDYRIRKLTPKECWRLMGWEDLQFEKAEKVNSDSQLYKQAGNGIVINVLEAIYVKMIEFGYFK